MLRFQNLFLVESEVQQNWNSAQGKLFKAFPIDKKMFHLYFNFLNVCFTTRNRKFK